MIVYKIIKQTINKDIYFFVLVMCISKISKIGRLINGMKNKNNIYFTEMFSDCE